MSILGSLITYGQCFAKAMATRSGRRLLKASFSPVEAREPARAEVLDRAIAHAADWLAHAQDQGNDDGIGSFHLLHGWGASYPETTGYIIPTWIAAAAHLGRPDLRGCAEKAGQWLLSIQRADGGWQGGRMDDDRPSVVFNTAQVVRGLLALHTLAPQAGYAGAAVRAGEWILSVQEADGAWRTHNFLGSARVYDSYVDAPLLALHAHAGDARFRAAAERNLAWIMAKQGANGWFADADNTIKHNRRPITHTIAYTVDGMLDCGLALQDEGMVAAARRTADAVLARYLGQGKLFGRYDHAWQGSEAAITTGCAQFTIIWAKLAEVTGEPKYGDAAQRMAAWLVEVQARSMRGPGDAHGALSGSFPLWGRYERFAFPNWGTKYFIDALIAVRSLH